MPRLDRSVARDRRVAAMLLAAAAIVGCAEGAPTDAGMTLSRERIAGVTVRMTPSRSMVAPGDTIAFIVSITNGTDASIELQGPCGPEADVQVTPASNGNPSVLAAFVGPRGVFTCERGPHHVLEPRETQVLALQWRAPAGRGDYRARAGLRHHDGLANASPALVVMVR
ncbi:MAG: hypothetical protein MUF21_06990 [Gemmatimonadaceae bacterium]|jgi:hypothetical protein|nr:hypothetical protein [Gemmatimonadaceae bacterium]